MHETAALPVCKHRTDSISAEGMLSPSPFTPLSHFVPAVFRLNPIIIAPASIIPFRKDIP